MNDLIRQAIAAEAEERVDSRTVLAELHKRKKKPFGLIIGVATLTVAAAAAAVIIPTTIKKTDASPAVQPVPATAQNVLLIGTDNNDYTDSLVLARFEADGSVRAVSLPRDIQVGDERLNRLFRQDPKKLTSTVEQLTSTKVDHYAVIKMSEFGRIAQLVGGVEVCVSAATVDVQTGATFPAGSQTLEGDRALQFLRQRMGLPMGDFDRIKRHQAFLAGLAAKINKDNALALAGEVGRSVRVDEGWDVLAFAQRFQGPVKIFTATLPITDPGVTPNGQGLGVDQAQAKQFVEAQFGGTAQPQDRCVN